VRVQIANSARSAPEWHSLFSRFNNGGYNNQWIIVDYKLFKAGSLPVCSSLKGGVFCCWWFGSYDVWFPQAANTLVVGEQVPGYYVVADQTAFLINVSVSLDDSSSCC
jgi:hypothetical protein